MKKPLRIMGVLFIVVFVAVHASMATILGLNGMIVLEEEIRNGDKSVVEGLDVELNFRYKPYNSEYSICSWKVVHSPGTLCETKTGYHYIPKKEEFNMDSNKEDIWYYEDYFVELFEGGNLRVYSMKEDGSYQKVLQVDLIAEKLLGCIQKDRSRNAFGWNGETLIMSGVNSDADMFIAAFNQSGNTFYATYDNRICEDLGMIWLDDDMPIRIFWD